jgi:hypothetical protein
VATFVGIAGGAVGFLLVLLLLVIVLVRRRSRAAAANKANLKRDYLTLRKADIDEWELDRTLLHLGKVCVCVCVCGWVCGCVCVCVL